MDRIEKFVEDRRRYPRIVTSLPLQYRNLRKSSEIPAGSVIRNISEGGIAFKSSEFISLACRLVVEISLPASEKPVKAISKVAWIKKLPVGDQYELGNQFLDMTKEDKDAIAGFVKAAAQTSV